MRIILAILERLSEDVSKHILSTSSRDHIYLVVKMIVTLSLTFLVTFPSACIAYFELLFSQFNFFLPKFAFFLVLVHIIAPYLKKRFYGDPTASTIEGVPIHEVVDHILSEWSFKRDDIERKFAIPRNRYQAIATKLDRSGVFIRGDNNARVLRDDITREMLVAALTSPEIPFIRTKIQTSIPEATKEFCEAMET